MDSHTHDPILHLPWVDIETTGLSPDEDHILEVGLVITDLSLEPVFATSFVLEQNVNALARLRATPVVWEMHTKNGLIEEIVNPEMTEPAWTVEAALTAVMEEYFGQHKPPMCGSSVHFDREFLRRYLNGFHNKFAYRNIDVSSLKELAQRWAPTVWANRPGQNDADKTHRASDDALASIAELRYYLETGLISRIDPTQED